MLKMETKVRTGYQQDARIVYTAGGQDVSIRTSDTSISIPAEQFDRVCEEYLLIRQRMNGRTR